MYEVISGLPPYHDVAHDKPLALSVCQGLRPKFNIKVPQLILHLIKRCLDANPLNRPTAFELLKILRQWYIELDKYEKRLSKLRFYQDMQSEITKQAIVADEINKNLPASSSSGLGLSYETHTEAIYTSRLLNFNNLPEPKNSDDYYHEQNDNIISKKFLGKFNKLFLYI